MPTALSPPARTARVAGTRLGRVVNLRSAIARRPLSSLFGVRCRHSGRRWNPGCGHCGN